MTRKPVLIKSKEWRTATDVAAFLRELADKIERGDVVLERGSDEVHVAIPDRVRFGIKVKRKQKKRGPKWSFKLNMKWTEGETSGRVKLA